MIRKSIYVTEPTLPSLEEFIPYLQEIWRCKVLTNGGQYHKELEQALCAYLNVPHITLFNNGTTALLVALKALHITGEVITTPYSFVATAHSTLWNGVAPVFVDIDPLTLNIDPDEIEAAITSHTTAIMPVHCYGNPCDVEKIQQIADKYSLKVIYDAAHAFGVEDEGGSILRYGDLSVLSFHATKVFHTFEGGAIVCRDSATKNYLDQLKNFGFVDETTVTATGINGKMNEVSAAMGVLQLKYVDAAIEKRKQIAGLYNSGLAGVRGIRVLRANNLVRYNYSYYPIFVETEYRVSRDRLYEILRANDIHARRYFYPLISNFPMYQKTGRDRNLRIANSTANTVLCLPIFPDLEEKVVAEICSLIVSTAESTDVNH